MEDIRVKTASLPEHPIFGTAIGIRRNGAPIWSICGAAEGDPPTTDPATPPNPANPAIAPGDEPLGEGGKKALEAERRRAAAAEKAKDAAEAKVRAFEDAQKSEADKTAERIAALEKDAAKALRYEAAEQAGLSLSLAARLNGSTLDELLADAEVLKTQMPGAAPVDPATPPAPPTPKPDRRQGGGESDKGGSMAAGKALYASRKK
jgi:hypothetical protein